MTIPMVMLQVTHGWNCPLLLVENTRYEFEISPNCIHPFLLNVLSISIFFYSFSPHSCVYTVLKYQEPRQSGTTSMDGKLIRSGSSFPVLIPRETRMRIRKLPRERYFLSTLTWKVEVFQKCSLAFIFTVNRWFFPMCQWHYNMSKLLPSTIFQNWKVCIWLQPCLLTCKGVGTF